MDDANIIFPCRYDGRGGTCHAPIAAETQFSKAEDPTGRAPPRPGGQAAVAMSLAGRAIDRNACPGRPAQNDGHRLDGRGDHGSVCQVSAYAIIPYPHTGMGVWP